ncbi:MAG: C1 family peptidase, partial [Euryarchaeota archaeon]|nr:C1 family peptidase [Euryarchaeota archaeon]
MSATAKFGRVSLIVAAVIVFSAFFIPGGTAQSINPHEHELLANIGGMNVAYHYLSAKEMQELKNAVGVREPNKNYNKIIDGHGTGLAPPSESEWQHMVNHLKVADAISGVRVTRGSVDLSKEKYFPPIGNQGQQGSCAAWAVNYYAHTFIEAEDHDWDAASGNRSYLMSPAWTYNMIDGGVDQGSTFTDNAMVLKTWGSASMATMPYMDSKHTGIGGPRAMREAPEHKIQDFYFINNTGQSMISEIKALIDKGIPVTFGIDADVFDSAFSDGNYIISSQEYSSDLQPNHGQTIIGYNDFITDDGDVGAFKIANSWGAGWGDKGFYWVTYKAFYEEVDYDNQAVPMYMVDIPHYQPKLLGVWEYNGTVEMNVNISFGIQTSSGFKTLNVFYKHEMPGVHVPFPQVMAFDLTPFYQDFENGSTNISLVITNTSAVQGTVYKFYVEKYGTTYTPGMPQEMSRNAISLPASLPCNATVDFKPYSPISLATAMDTNLLTFMNTTSGQSGWVAVPY